MNLFNNLQQQYEQLWKYIIRPTRKTYPEKNLGPLIFQLQGKKVKRVDFELINPRGYVIFCSHFVPLQQQKYSCLIYMHGNSSNRTEGMQYLGALIRQNISLCTFDFSGCGNSEGDYVSLGFYQQDDLNQVIQYIRHRPQITSIAIWGRSMGAVTGLLYLRKSIHVSAAVFDSPFKSLKSLTQDLCRKNSKIPQLIISGALKIIAGTIQDKAKFDIYKLNPLKYEVPFLKYPAFFIVGMQDDMIPPQHTIALFEKYKGQQKYLEKIKGNHNDTRPQECVEKIITFLCKHLHKKQSSQKISQTKSQKGQVQEEFNFFDDDNQIVDSTKQTQNIDFFDINSEKVENRQGNRFENFLLENTQSLRGQESNGSKKDDVFSFSSMFSNVMTAISGQNKERGVDGYESMIEKISREMFLEETNWVKEQKDRRKRQEERRRAEMKDVRKDEFEKQILGNLANWAY